MPQNNPKQESNVKQRSNASFAGNSANGQEAELREQLSEMIEQGAMALCCNNCRGGGYDYENTNECDTCKGTGLTEWRNDYLLEQLERYINTHTTKLLNEQLDRIGEPTLNDIVLDDPKSYQDTLKIVRWYKSAIENERKKLR